MFAVVLIAFFTDVWPYKASRLAQVFVAAVMVFAATAVLGLAYSPAWLYVSGHAGSIISALVDIQTSKLMGQLEGAPPMTNSTRTTAGRHG
jgi:hypothetical protein